MCRSAGRAAAGHTGGCSFRWRRGSRGSRHLASRLPGMAARRLPDDWRRRYGCQPVLLETFVEKPRFAGTGYRAANWHWPGDTRGRGKSTRPTGFPVQHLVAQHLPPSGAAGPGRDGASGASGASGAAEARVGRGGRRDVRLGRGRAVRSVRAGAHAGPVAAAGGGGPSCAQSPRPGPRRPRPALRSRDAAEIRPEGQHPDRLARQGAGAVQGADTAGGDAAARAAASSSAVRSTFHPPPSRTALTVCTAPASSTMRTCAESP